MGWISWLCDGIILVGAVVVAIKNIAAMTGKPLKIFRDKHKKEIAEVVNEVLQEKLPQEFNTHDLETRDKYLADRLNYLNEIKEEVLLDVEKELDLVISLNKQYNVLAIGIKDVLREKIMAIYFKGVKTKEISQHDYEALVQYYKDYKAMGGNSYIDKYYERMMTWKKIDENIEDVL